jgi:putative endonuclease
LAIHNELGRRGEQEAVKFLEGKGYSIVAINWRHEKAEVDIIAEIEKFVVFVEVKTRTSNYFGRPEEFVDITKERLLINAADHFMEAKNYNKEVRFDIISVIILNDDTKINHLEDCFSGMG